MNNYTIFKSYWPEARTELIPGHCLDGLLRYIEHGIKPGSFLTALLSNDLFLAMSKADDTNQYAFRGYCVFLHNWAPRDCFGTPEAVRAWCEKGGMAGRKEGEVTE